MLLLSSLERIVKSDKRHFKDNVEPRKAISLKKEQQERRLKEKFDRLFENRRETVLHDRISSLPTSRASKYAIAGDEFHLRQEIVLGFPVNEVDPRSGRTVLLEAVAGGYLHLVRMLINEFNCDLSCVTKLGKATALHIAVECGHRQIASMLITHGADINKQDMFGRTPLHLVKHLSLFKLLMKYPVDVVAKTNKGLTPLGYYYKNTPPAERIDEIIAVLSSREDKRLMEVTREQVSTAKQDRAVMLDHWGLVTDNSTMRYYDEQQSKPW